MKILNITIGSLALVLLSNQGAYSASISIPFTQNISPGESDIPVTVKVSSIPTTGFTITNFAFEPFSPTTGEVTVAPTTLLVNAINNSTVFGTEKGDFSGDFFTVSATNDAEPNTFSSTFTLFINFDGPIQSNQNVLNSNFSLNSNTISLSSPFNVTVVPEPLTILGTVTAIGFGTAFKRKLGKAKKK